MWIWQNVVQKHWLSIDLYSMSKCRLLLYRHYSCQWLLLSPQCVEEEIMQLHAVHTCHQISEEVHHPVVTSHHLVHMACHKTITDHQLLPPRTPTEPPAKDSVNKVPSNLVHQAHQTLTGHPQAPMELQDKDKVDTQMAVMRYGNSTLNYFEFLNIFWKFLKIPWKLFKNSQKILNFPEKMSENSLNTSWSSLNIFWK